MDGGHFIGWAPMYLSVPDPHAMVLMGTAFQSIGLGFGSAAGVSVARPERTTVLVSGYGGGLMGLSDFEAHTLGDLGLLESWLATHDDGMFVLDVAISQKVIAEFMAESLAAKG